MFVENVSFLPALPSLPLFFPSSTPHTIIKTQDPFSLEKRAPYLCHSLGPLECLAPIDTMPCEGGVCRQTPVWGPQRVPLQAAGLIRSCPELVTQRRAQQALAVARKPRFPGGTQHNTCRLSLIT